MKVTFPRQLLVVLLTQSLAILCDSSFRKCTLLDDAINWWLKNFTCVRDFLYLSVPETSDEQKPNFLNWNLQISRVMVNIVVIDQPKRTQ